MCGCGLPGPLGGSDAGWTGIRNTLLGLVALAALRAPDLPRSARLARLGVVALCLGVGWVPALVRREEAPRAAVDERPLERIEVVPAWEPDAPPVRLSDLRPSRILFFEGKCPACARAVRDWNLLARGLPVGEGGAVAVGLDGVEAVRALDRRERIASPVYYAAQAVNPCLAWGVCAVPQAWEVSPALRVTRRWGAYGLRERAEGGEGW